MSHVPHKRRARAGSAAAACLVATGSLALMAPTPAQAALSGTITVTAPTNGKVAALTAKQVVILTVSGSGAPTLNETSVTGVKLGGDASCANIQTYVVSSATTITVKTPPGGCPASPGGTAEGISININGDTLDKASAITFINAPGVGDLANVPVFADNSLNVPDASKVVRFNSAGGQVVRVEAAADFAFDPRSSAALSVTFGGKAGTDVKVYDSAAPTTALANTVAGSVGNSLTFKTPTGLSTSDTNLTISQNGVSKTFAAAATGVSGISGNPTITGLTPTSGRSNTAVNVAITGTNFDKDATKYGASINVTFCGVAATAWGTPAVNTAGTTINVVVPNAIGGAASPGLGATKYAGPCDVVVTDGTAAGTSPVTPASTYTLLKE